MITLNVAEIFGSQYIGGRYRETCMYSGEEFRDDHLIPAIRSNPGVDIVIDMTGVLTTVTWMEEVFGGLVRELTVNYHPNHIYISGWMTTLLGS